MRFNLALWGLCGAVACSSGSPLNGNGGREPRAQTTSARLTAIPRTIPLRFVEFIPTSTSTSLTEAQLNEQVTGASQVFAPAGIQFALQHNPDGSPSLILSGTGFEDTTVGGTFTWPNPPGTAPPLAFNPSCNPSTQDESEESALFRAGTYCGFDGEILVFIVESNGAAHGTYPWEANAVVMMRNNLTCGNRTLAHELGHFLGLSHPFGGGFGYDLDSANLKNPETGATANLSDFWDLVYSPGDSTNAHAFFSSQTEAAAVESSLIPIRTDSATLGTICGASADPNTTPTCPGGGHEPRRSLVAWSNRLDVHRRPVRRGRGRTQTG